jgi:hypothetical protein
MSYGRGVWVLLALWRVALRAGCGFEVLNGVDCCGHLCAATRRAAGAVAGRRARRGWETMKGPPRSGGPFR